MLEQLLPRWRSKVLVLCLLGFAATDFVITITMSAADATAHIIENPLVPHWMEHRVAVTLVLLAALGAIFLKGFREAIGLAVALVVLYLALNVVVIGWGIGYIFQHPEVLPNWRQALFTQHGSWPMMIGVVADPLPEARARPVGIRDRRRRDAAHQGRPGRHRRESRGPHPRRAEAAAHRRADHERRADRQQLRHARC